MDNKRKERVLHCLLTGKLYLGTGKRRYYLIYPSQEIRTLSYVKYDEVLSSFRFAHWLNKKSAQNILVERGIISSDIDLAISSLRNRLDNLKVELYRAMFSTTNDVRIREEIRMVFKEMSSLENEKNSISEFTLEGYAMKARFLVLLAGSLYRDSGERVFSDKEAFNVSSKSLDGIIRKKIEVEPQEREIREIARTSPWSSYWSFGKPNPLEIKVTELSEYQQILYMYSQMFSNIRESIDCPSDNIINDDWCCDGWLILQSRKMNEERKQRQAQKVTGKKMSKAQEIFLPVKGKEDFNRVNSLNTVGNKIKIEQRKRQMEKGPKQDGEFFDQKLAMRTMSTENLKQRQKK